MQIRAATSDDAAAIAALWNPIIRDTTVTFTTQEHTSDSLAARIAAKSASGEPFCVAHSGDEIFGFATYGPFRSGPGYRHAIEHTIILAPAARGQGLGRALLGTLETAARAQGKHAMIAGVSGDNPDAIAFHEACGFAEVGRLPQIGWKFGRWLDLVLLHKLL